MLLSIIGCSQEGPTTTPQPPMSMVLRLRAWCGPGTRGSKDVAMSSEVRQVFIPEGSPGSQTFTGGILCVRCFEELSSMKAGGASGLGMMGSSNPARSSEEGGGESPVGCVQEKEGVLAGVAHLVE